jgi:hypothetical protein
MGIGIDSIQNVPGVFQPFRREKWQHKRAILFFSRRLSARRGIAGKLIALTLGALGNVP